nr:MAG TPA: Deoxyhypusine synthase [Caudoviricetes sp.]
MRRLIGISIVFLSLSGALCPRGMRHLLNKI